LNNMEAWNYEANTQLYNNTIGLLSFSAFYKKIDNYFHVVNNLSLDPGRFDSLCRDYNLVFTDPAIKSAIGSANNIAANIPYNNHAPSYVWGFEFEHQMNLGFVPVTWLQNVTLSYNVSLTRSLTQILYGKAIKWTTRDSTFGGLPKHWIYTNTDHSILTYKLLNRDSEGQPEIYGNVALGYDIGGFSARLSFFYQDSYVRQYSASDQANIVVNPFAKLDLSLKQQITKNITVFLNLNNLMNRSETTSVNNDVTVNGISNWSNPSTEELYGRTIDLGLRLSL
jgi:outer membrane receptor protein involved in Fe transport